MMTNPRPKKRVVADLSEICIAMEDRSFAFQYYLDLETGEVLAISESEPQLDGEILRRIEEDPDRYEPIPSISSREAYGHMDDFIHTVSEGALRDQLSRAIQGSGVFRRFKDILSENPEEQIKWYDFKDKILKREAVEWLEALGIEAKDKYPRGNRVGKEIEESRKAIRDSIDMFVELASQIDSVIDISLFGSLAGKKRLAKDIDLMVFVEDTKCIDELALFKRKVYGRYHCSLDVFVLTKEGEFLGNICLRKKCPTLSDDCRVPGCGKIKYIQKYADFDFKASEAVKHGLKLLWLNPRYPKSISENLPNQSG